MKIKKVEEEVVKEEVAVENQEEHLKVFISQPMGGKTLEEILDDRATLILKVEKILNNPSFIDNIEKDGDVNPLESLGRSIEKLAEADIAVFAEGYKKSRGCKIEYTCCEKYGIPILHI